MASLYEKDFYGWCMHQADCIQNGNQQTIDWENLLEEIKSLGQSEFDNLVNRFAVLFEHLLKCEYQPDKAGNSWISSIKEQRYRISKLLKKNPSLKPRIKEAAIESYPIAIFAASKETGIPSEKFSQEIPYSIEFALEGVKNDNFV